MRFNIKEKIKKTAPVHIVLGFYFLIAIVTMIAFSLPIFRIPGSHLKFIDLAYFSVSTISLTGLANFQIHEFLNTHGIILLEVIFQICGFGVMMITTFVFILSRRKIGVRTRQLIMVDTNQNQMSGVVRMIKIIFLTYLGIQAVFGFLFGLYFYFGHYYKHLSSCFFWGIYNSVSALTNSGFDIFGNSLKNFNHHYLFLLMVILLMFIGSIGYPVTYEIFMWASSKDKKRFTFSLFTRVAVFGALFLIIFGTLIIFLLERTHLFAGTTPVSGFFTSFFYSVSTRNAGLELHDISAFRPVTLLFFCLLMFIGSSPSSVGGGVRTTTIFIVILHMASYIRGERDTIAFERRIDLRDIQKAYVVLVSSVALCTVSFFLIMACEDHPPLDIILEVASAFGTTGMTSGLAQNLGILGKLVMIVLMFVGRVSMLYFLTLFLPRDKKINTSIRYPSEKIIVG
ncbi:MAG: TrkH family potassium uptake protein [Lactobacillales bacterium]|nr:TrkH family potassium uptake protein [Lactobacillales bacterium]